MQYDHSVHRQHPRYPRDEEALRGVRFVAPEDPVQQERYASEGRSDRVLRVHHVRRAAEGHAGDSFGTQQTRQLGPP